MFPDLSMEMILVLYSSCTSHALFPFPLWKQYTYVIIGYPTVLVPTLDFSVGIILYFTGQSGMYSGRTLYAPATGWLNAALVGSFLLWL